MGSRHIQHCEIQELHAFGFFWKMKFNNFICNYHFCKKGINTLVHVDPLKWHTYRKALSVAHASISQVRGCIEGMRHATKLTRIDPENSGKISKNMSPSCGGKLVVAYLQAPMASCHRRRDDGHHPSAEFSEWL